MKSQTTFLRLAPIGVLVAFGLAFWSSGTWIAHAWPYLDLLRAAPAPCGCSSLLTLSDDPRFFFMLLGMISVMSLYLAAVSGSLVRQFLQTRRFLRTISVNGTSNTTERGWRSIQHAAPWSFTAGLLRPQIFLSTATTQKLSQEEVESVLAHEAYHARRFHPLVRWLLQGFFAPLRWIPGLRGIEQMVILAQETAADAFAVQSNGKQHLLRAFTKLADADAPAIPVPSFHVTNLRLQLLLDEPIHLPTRKFSGAVLSLAGILLAAHAALGMGPTSSILQQEASQLTPKMCIQLMRQERALQSKISPAACPMLLQSQPTMGITFTNPLE